MRSNKVFDCAPGFVFAALMVFGGQGLARADFQLTTPAARTVSGQDATKPCDQVPFGSPVVTYVPGQNAASIGWLETQTAAGGTYSVQLVPLFSDEEKNVQTVDLKSNLTFPGTAGSTGLLRTTQVDFPQFLAWGQWALQVSYNRPGDDTLYSCADVILDINGSLQGDGLIDTAEDCSVSNVGASQSGTWFAVVGALLAGAFVVRRRSRR
jgi:MYXO-CTERM domain-containing protein